MWKEMRFLSETREWRFYLDDMIAFSEKVQRYSSHLERLRLLRQSPWPSAKSYRRVKIMSLYVRVISLLLLVAPCAAITPAFAQNGNPCSAEIEAALRSANTQSAQSAIVGNFVAQDCKPWPGSDGKLMAAVMAFQQEEKNPGDANWIVVIALLDAQTHRIHSSRRANVESDAMTAIDGHSFRLDTARYWVKPGVRALGLRFFSAARGPSAPEARWENELSLFVPNKRELQPVFQIATSAQMALTGCISVWCKGSIWHEALMTLNVGATASNGWNELVVHETTTSVNADDDPSEDKATRSSADQHRQFIYRYDGKIYKRVTRETPFWDAFCCILSW